MNKEVTKGYKFRIYPTEEQKEWIEKTFSACAYVYNGMLAYREHRYKDFKEKLSEFNLKKKLTEIKKCDDWLREFDGESLCYAIRDMDRAYTGWIKQLKKKGIVYSKNTLSRCKRKGIEPQPWMAEKHPKFKSKKNPKQSFTTRRKTITKSTIKLGKKIGTVKILLHSGFKPQQIKEITVSKAPTGKFYASVIVNEEIKIHEKSDNQIGVDLGVKNFAVTSNCCFYSIPKRLWQYESRIEFLQKKLNRQKKDSERYSKTKLLIAKHHKKIVNIRSNFLHNLSNKLIKENQLIALEDLNVKRMMSNRRLARAIGRMGFYQFRNILNSKAEWHDREIHAIDRWFPSSKTCSNCGTIKNNLKISDRVYECNNCGLKIDRDYNASINILRESLKK